MRIKSTVISPKSYKVMISGYFEGIHSGHLDYLLQAVRMGNIICIVASDSQVLLKKGVVKIPERERLLLVATMLRGLGSKFVVCLNYWDKDTTITETLKKWKPKILFRGYDKKIETMPPTEYQVCKELGIEIIHAKPFIGERHSTEIFK